MDYRRYTTARHVCRLPMAFQQGLTPGSLGLADSRLSAVAESEKTVRHVDGASRQVRADLQRSDGKTFRSRHVGPVDGTNGVGAKRAGGSHQFRRSQRDHARARYRDFNCNILII